MWLLNKISCEIQILNEKVGKLMIENGELEEENKKLKEDNKRLREGVDAGQKLVEDLISKNKKLKERINTMQEFIDYSEGVVQNAIGMLYEEGGEDKALDYLENCYATGDDKQYEEMERLYKNED